MMMVDDVMGTKEETRETSEAVTSLVTAGSLAGTNEVAGVYGFRCGEDYAVTTLVPAGATKRFAGAWLVGIGEELPYFPVIERVLPHGRTLLVRIPAAVIEQYCLMLAFRADGEISAKRFRVDLATFT